MSQLASPRETEGKASSRASGDPYLCHSLQKEHGGGGEGHTRTPKQGNFLELNGLTSSLFTDIS